MLLVVVVVAVEVVVGGGAQPAPFANTFITGSGLLKTSLHGVKKKRGGVRGDTAPPPSERVRRYLKRLCAGFWHLPSLDIVTVLSFYDYDYYS